jgi:hypothetical protein
VQLPPTKVLTPLSSCLLDLLAVDRIQHDDGVVVHAQGGGGVDPVAVPAGGAQPGIDFLGVVAALAGQHHVQRLEGVDVVGVLQGAGVFTEVGGRLTGLGGGEEDRIDTGEIAFFHHAAHQDGADHATPADQTYFFHHRVSFLGK